MWVVFYEGRDFEGRHRSLSNDQWAGEYYTQDLDAAVWFLDVITCNGHHMTLDSGRYIVERAIHWRDG